MICLQARSNVLSADMIMKVLVKAASFPNMVNLLIVDELQDLFTALTNCKYEMVRHANEDTSFIKCKKHLFLLSV
jgi:Cdc6-like AAA superfamily ATPase